MRHIIQMGRDADRATYSIELSTGEKYTPEKGPPPVMPCPACKDNHLRAMGACHSGFGICPSYMDYEHMKTAYRMAVFDRPGKMIKRG